jgi:hypothetical protein
VLEQLRPYLADLMGGPPGFARTLTSLSPDDQFLLIDALGAQLADLIRQARFQRNLFAIMSALEPDQKMLATLSGSGLRVLIPTTEELTEVLGWPYSVCDQETMELTGNTPLRNIVRHASDLTVSLNSVDAHAQRDLIDRIGRARVEHLIRDSIDLASLLRPLPAELSAPLLDGITRERLLALIGNAADWEYLWNRWVPPGNNLIANKPEATCAALTNFYLLAPREQTRVACAVAR